MRHTVTIVTTDATPLCIKDGVACYLTRHVGKTVINPSRQGQGAVLSEAHE